MPSNPKEKPVRKSKSEYNRTYYEKHKEELKVKRAERRLKKLEEAEKELDQLNMILSE